MPEFFYWSYLIDPSAIGCWKIITVDCNNLHHYVDPCDLISDCIEQLPQQLTKQCVVDFFNTTLPTVPAWYFLRVDASHCIEAIPLLINNDDKLVAVNATDTPGYLWAKIVWSTHLWYTIAVNVIWAMGNQQLQLMITPPSQVVIPVPVCQDWILRSNSDWSTYRDCGDGDNWYRAVRYATSDLVPNLVTNMYQSFLFTTSAARGWITLSHTPTMDVFKWNSWMNWSWTYDWMIRIQKSGMYEVRMKGEAVINNWVSRIRLFVCTPITSPWVPKILIDAKYWAEDTFPGSFANAPYQWDAGTDWLVSMTITLNWHTLIRLDAWTYLALGCKIDSRETNWVTPTVDFRSTVYDLDPVGVGWSNSEVAYDWPGISFWAAFYSSHKR